MKLGVLSDLHLEFGRYTEPYGTGDVLILSGDIHVAAYLAGAKVNPELEDQLTRYQDFIRGAMQNYNHVVAVMGNHEHYDGVVNYSYYVMQQSVPEEFKDRFFMLEKEAVNIGGVAFYGATLWTDFNGNDPVTRLMAGQQMNDYHKSYIEDVYGDRKLMRPEDTLEDHEQALEALKLVQQQVGDAPMVVCTHHAPSRKSTHPRYRHSYTTNGCYSTNLEHLMGGQIKLWTHGHTHNSYDYDINGTRIICNPRGYVGHHMNPNFNPVMEVEVNAS